MKIKQILLCMLLACFILPASAQNSWGIVGGGLFSKSLSRDARFSLGGYAGGMYDVHVKNSWYVQPQLLFTYEEFRSKTRLGTDSFFSKFNLELPILASYNVALNNKWNLRINAGPYLSLSLIHISRTTCVKYFFPLNRISISSCKRPPPLKRVSMTIPSRLLYLPRISE